tara:strand:- start:2641 stop:3432 length:792 start_codon:yes stop_codon:yes gene_type:complete
MVPLNISLIQNELNIKTIGREIRFWDKTDSTNELAKSCRNESEGLVFLAEVQCHGRGRLRRSWYSPEGLGIYLSVLLKPKIALELLSQSTLMAGVAVAEAIKPFLSNSKPFLKWPNDVILNDRKLSGILCEYCPPENNADGALIVGIGVNVNHQLQDFPKELQSTATSLKMASHKRFERETVIHSLLQCLDDEYDAFLNDGSPTLIQKWSDRTNQFGKTVSLSYQDQVYTGTAIRLDEMGRLIMQLDNGEIIRFENGELIESP